MEDGAGVGRAAKLVAERDLKGEKSYLIAGVYGKQRERMRISNGD